MRGRGADGPALNSLIEWFQVADDRLRELSTDFPACWGAQYRIGDPGAYVSESAFHDVLADELQRDTYLVVANRWGGPLEGLAEVAERAGDGAWMAERAREACEGCDAAAFYTEDFPDSYTQGELDELLEERPDLFGDDDASAFPEIRGALLRARRSRQAPTAGAAEGFSVRTPLGVLAARPWGEDGAYDGMLVELRKPDGTVGTVSVIEVVSGAEGADLAERGECLLRTIALDGRGAAEVVECDPDGDDMRWAEHGGIDELEAECAAPAPAPARRGRAMSR